MARAPQNYASNLQLSSTVADIVGTVTTNTMVVVRKLSFYNSGTVNRTVTVHVVESSGAADTGNTLVVKAIPPGKTWNVIEIQGEILETGMKVQAKQDVGTDVNANCSGADIT
ncbi:MAG: hypothetical protein JKY52_09300 [Flavobacteriales bacterium]|nr:hypothetical protein [Flavobacteriales bacterium]